MFNFQNARPRVKKFTRETSGIPRGQSFTFKYRPILSSKGKSKAEEENKEFVPKLTHQFEISKEKFNELGLSNHSVAWMADYDEDGKITGVALIVTSEEDENANTFKGNRGEKKGLYFTHEQLESDLAEAGIITLPKNEKDKKCIGKNQRLDFVYVADIESTDPVDGEYVILDKGEGLPVYSVQVHEETEEDNATDPVDVEEEATTEEVEA